MIAGRYSLEREIGRGGMGAVWLGRDEVLGRQVALKRIGLLPGADSTDLARAEREARLSARLNHPHVVSVFDLVVDAGSDARWLVMEYVEGTTIAQLVRRGGPLSPDAAAPLLWQAADALVAAHAAGIVHRDVKPSNILVNRKMQVKLTDFGIARITTDATLTQTGMVTGSPAYLAPEIATGTRGDEAADVWSLGATIFYVLAGRPPYETGDHVLSTLYRIVNEDPPRLADAGWMTPLLEGTMVKDPSRRWSMEQVRDFLADPHPEAAEATRVLPPVEPAPAPVAEESPPVADEPPPVAEEPPPVAEPAPLVAEPPPVVPPSPPAATPGRGRPSRKVLVLGVGAVLAVVLAAVLFAVLSSGDSAKDNAASPPTRTPKKSATSSPSATPGPTAAGMESFIRDYVSTVSSDPDTSWKMLTPKFQRESGGLDTYRRFWESATNGQVRSISADPRSLVVSYQVHFDNFKNGPGPTVLQLKYDQGRYLIDGESTKGFVPAG